MAPGTSSQRVSVVPSHALRRRVLVAAAACGIAAVGIRWVAVKLQNALLYHPRPIHGNPTYEALLAQATQHLQRYGYTVEALNYTSKGQQTALLVRPEPQRPSPLWLVFGGNAMVSVDWLPFCDRVLSSKDGSVGKPSLLLVDYPGYGDNSGEPSPGSVLEASKRALERVLEHLPAPPESVNLFGHSLGAAAAAQLAVELLRSDRPPGRLLLSSPFLSLEDMASVLLGGPRWLLRGLITHHWDNAKAVPAAAAGGWQVFIVHPKRDEIVPVAQGQELQKFVEKQGKSCQLVQPEGCGHNDVLFAALGTYAALLGSRL
ncbi:unnamed protein product [Effrenium voratum]|uniref:AB hydrolase-1 domain-containing protein n=1 Tax=Effrenium voratum TaxID=2562239 RepID=A0AA36HXE9_9DINO|nr:unnamed protein product [Effrenium voratum]CAJ1422179.1 unnamed protein product [Effrenium voratum]